MNMEKDRMGNLKVGVCVLLSTFLLLLATVATACAPASDEPKPPEIAYGRDMCDACGMVISEARFAAATLMVDGKTLKFDDAGEMFAYHLNHNELNVRAWFVHDYDSQTWIVGDTAYYVVSAEVKSPMGSGLAAFSDRAKAEAFSNRVAGRLLSFGEVRKEKTMMGKKGM